MLPADVQLREDALLGAAFRRVEKAAERVYHRVTRLVWHDAYPLEGTPEEWDAETEGPEKPRCIRCHTSLGIEREHGFGPTPAAALTALAEALEARE